MRNIAYWIFLAPAILAGVCLHTGSAAIKNDTFSIRRHARKPKVQFAFYPLHTDMRGTNGLVLYLDFDGVLHHENCLWHPARGAYLVAPPRYSLFQHAALLEQLMEPYPAVEIVLSTSWVRRYGCSATAKRLPPRLRDRVIGATFHSRWMNDGDFSATPRGIQVFEDVLRRRPRAWLALDDNGEGWPAQHAARFVQTHMYEGVSDPDVQAEFGRKLREMCA